MIDLICGFIGIAGLFFALLLFVKGGTGCGPKN